VLIAGALVVTLAVVSTAHKAERATSTGRTASASQTPLWSSRRVPSIVIADAVQQRFASVIAGFAAPGRCVAVDGATGSLARVAKTLAFAPASTEKLLTGAAALDALGADHRFTTAAVSTGALSGGTLHGDLVLVGGGDPVLATPDYRARLASDPVTASEPTTNIADLASALVRAGVQRVDGGVVADDSHYDTLRYLPSLKPSERSDIGPLGALTVDGGFASPGVAAPDPALLAAGALQTALANAGVTVSGTSRRGAKPAAARTIARVRSPRLDAIVESMLTVSNNYTAEMLARAVGVAVEHEGTSAAGLRGIVATLRKLRVPTAGVSLADGSGLSPQDRVTCPALLGAVELGDRSAFRALRDGLPIAGRTGTLALRFLNDPLTGRLRAKTGHINGVVGLAGVVSTPAGSLSFAFIANGNFSDSFGQGLQDQIAHLVGSYPVIPDAPHLVPAPVA